MPSTLMHIYTTHMQVYTYSDMPHTSSQNLYTLYLVCTQTVPPAIIAQPQAIVDAREWSEVKITCIASGIPAPRIEWEREGGAPLPVGAQNSPIAMTENVVILVILT